MSEQLNGKVSVQTKVEERKIDKDHVKTKLNSVLKFLPNIIINLAAVIALAFLTVLVLDFDGDYLLSFKGVVTSIALMAIFIASHWSSFDMRVKALKAKKENQEYQVIQEEKIKKIVNTLSWFEHKEEFVNERNLNKKMEKWKIIVQNSIVALEKKAKKKDLDVEALGITEYQKTHLSPYELEKLEKEIIDKKKRCKYIQRKRALEEMLNDKWIAVNVGKKNFDYNKIDVLFIETGSIIKGQEKDKTEKKGKYTKDNSGMRIYSLIISIFLSAITADLIIDSFTSGAWFIFWLRIMILVLNVAMGLNYGDNYYVETDIHNVDSRVMIADEFKVWALKKGYAK